jgi:hypothetical protein
VGLKLSSPHAARASVRTGAMMRMVDDRMLPPTSGGRQGVGRFRVYD